MLRLFYVLFHGCDHKWQGVGTGRYRDDMGGSGNVAFCVCGKCGRPKAFYNAVAAKRRGGV